MFKPQFHRPVKRSCIQWRPDLFHGVTFPPFDAYTVHLLNTYQIFMDPVATLKKRFEIRKNDRNFQVGDRLILTGIEPAVDKYSIPQMTGHFIECAVTYVLPGGQFGLADGFVVLGIEALFEWKPEESSPVG
ncbi:MAG: DUF3850 domain-containing protein [Pseudomonadota bacterium]